MKICPYGSLRSHGRSLRSLPVPCTFLSSPYPPPPIHIPLLGRPGRRGRPSSGWESALSVCLSALALSGSLGWPFWGLSGCLLGPS